MARSNHDLESTDPAETLHLVLNTTGLEGVELATQYGEKRDDGKVGDC